MERNPPLQWLVRKYKAIGNATYRLYYAVSDVYSGTVSSKAGASERQVKRRQSVFHQCFYLVFATVLALILVHSDPDSEVLPDIKVGEVADQEIHSPVSTEIELKDFARASSEPSKRVAPVFDHNDTAIETWQAKWTYAMRTIRQEWYNGATKLPPRTELVEKLGQKIHHLTGQRLSTKDIYFLHQHRFSESIELTFQKIVSYLSNRFIAERDLFPLYYRTGIVVRQVNQDLRETLIFDLSRIWSLEQVSDFLSHVPDLLGDRDKLTQRVTDFVKHIVVANLKLNKSRTEARINAYLAAHQPTVISVRKGQTLVRKGERLSEQQAELLQRLRYFGSRSFTTISLAITAVILWVFLSILFRIKFTRQLAWHNFLKDSFVFMLVAVINLAAVKYSFPIIKDLLANIGVRFGSEYVFPIVTLPLLVHLMLGKEAGFVFAIITSLLTGYVADKNYWVSVWVFAITIAAFKTIKGCKERADLYRCGAYSGMISVLFVFAIYLNHRAGFKETDWISTSVLVGFSFFFALIAPIMTGAVIPVLESVFGYTTSLKLLELSNFNHPLLHALMVKAPGTYHHSVIVGNLAETAADRIHANGLLARVAAYYHDIGKMTKPLYFIENQAPNNNPHDSLQPSMSAKILFSHVKAGARMAYDYHLGKDIIHIIEQHHGTTIVYYFLNRARQLENRELSLVDESDFRYPGPKPQSKEAALVMLADACEAATRSIVDPTPAKIQTMVRNVINRRVSEHQFDECFINFNDLQIIEECFTRTLVSLYHHRIEYPGQKNQLQHAPTHAVTDKSLAVGEKGVY